MSRPDSDLVQCGPGVVVAAHLHEPAGRVGQGEDGHEEQEGGDGRDPEHDSPPVAVGQQVVGEVGHEDAHGDGQLVEGDHATADAAGASSAA